MTVAHADHGARIEAGIGFEWDRIPRTVTSLAEVDPDATDACFRRERASHRGLHRRATLRRLWADAVDASFLEEIASMRSLEVLYLQRVTAPNLQPLADLPRLRRLVVKDAPRIDNLEWTTRLPAIESLGLENLRRVTSLEPLANLTGLRALGVEGSMWTPMRVATLQPLSVLARMESLFLTNLRVLDGSLQPLHGLPALRVLQCARYFADDEFAALAAARSGLRCTWLPPRQD